MLIALLVVFLAAWAVWRLVRETEDERVSRILDEDAREIRGDN